MDLFRSTRPTGIFLGRGVPPEPPQVLFPGAGKHLPRVLRLLPPLDSGVVDMPLSLAIDAVVHCLKPSAPDEHVAAFLDCLLPVDKMNVGDPHSVWELAHKLSGDAVGLLAKAGIHWLRKDKREFAYKMIHGGRSTWVRVNRERAQKVLRLVAALERESTYLPQQDDNRHRSRSPHRGLETTSSASSQHALSDTSGNSDAQ